MPRLVLSAGMWDAVIRAWGVSEDFMRGHFLKADPVQEQR